MDKLAEFIFIVCVAALFYIGGYATGKSVAGYDYQDAAVERGYAEWVPPEDPRGKQVWQWVEPK